MASISDVEGIGPKYAEKLSEAGITTTEKLLETGATSKGRKDLAASTGLSGALLLEWVNHVDLMRIKGVGSEYSDLLEAAGVDSVPELSRRVPANLAAKLAEVNEAKNIVRSVPSEKVVTGWVEQAKELPTVVTH